MTDRRVLIAAALSVLFISLYSNAFLRPSRKAQILESEKVASMAGETTAGPARMGRPRLTDYYQTAEEATFIESQHLRLEIGMTTGDILSASLLAISDHGTPAPVIIKSQLPILHLLDSPYSVGQSVTTSHGSALIRQRNSQNGAPREIKYSLDANNPILRISMLEPSKSAGEGSADQGFIFTWAHSGEQSLDRSYNVLEFISGFERKGGVFAYRRYRAPLNREEIVPRGTRIGTIANRYFCQSIRIEGSSTNFWLIPSPAGTMAMEALFSQHGGSWPDIEIYFGPKDYFHLNRAGFEKAFPIGILGKIGLVLLSLLSLIAGITKNYGVAIVLLSGIITILLAPLTVIGARSMKKLQQLKPVTDKIMAEHKGDPAKAHQAVSQLWKEHRVSPLSGCLPVSLNIPIVIAMFQAIPNYIELRGKSFLWIHDLSLPDRLAHLGTSLPLMGNEINALPILMAVAMAIQTRQSQPATSVGSSDQTTKLMAGPLMPIMFLVMCYHLPAGLVLYWLSNTLLSVWIYRIAK